MTVTTTSRHRSPVPDPDSADLLFHKLMTGPRRPSHWYDAKDLRTEFDEFLPNRMGSFPSELQFGSTPGPDSSDPLRPRWAGQNYVFMDNTVNFGNVVGAIGQAVTPTGADWRIRSSVRVFVPAGGFAADVTPFGARSNRRQLRVLTPRRLSMTVSRDGGTNTSSTAEELPSAVDNSWVWIEGSYRQDTAVAAFRYSLSDARRRADVPEGSWVSIADGAAGATSGALPLAVEALAVSNSYMLGNGSSTALLPAVSVAAARAEEGDGTLVEVCDFCADDILPTDSATVASEGYTWTVNRSTTGLKTALVTRSTTLFDGVNDWCQLALADYSGALDADETIMQLVRVHDDTATTLVAFTNRNTSNNTSALQGVGLRVAVTPGVSWSVRAIGGDGTTTFPGAGESQPPGISTFGGLRAIGWRYTHATRRLRPFHTDGATLAQGTSPGIDLSGFGTTANGVATRIGATTGGAGPAAFEMPVPFIRNPALLTDAEVIDFAARLIAGSYE